MKAFVKYSFMFVAFANTAMAATGEHHEPSITDLTYPAINFIVLFGFLIWKFKKPMSEMFNKKAEEVKSLMTSAAEKSKAAQDRLSTLQNKMKNLDSEVAKIKADYESDASTFTKNQAAETLLVIARVKRDLENKLEGEKNELVDQINHDLINKVIAQTQETIKSSADMKTRATQKIVSELR